jgi:hypothetical protein
VAGILVRSNAPYTRCYYFALGAKSKTEMSTHPPGGTHPRRTPTLTPKRLVSPVFGKILGQVEIWEVAKIAAMLLREGASLASESDEAGKRRRERSASRGDGHGF